MHNNTYKTRIVHPIHTFHSRATRYRNLFAHNLIHIFADSGALQLPAAPKKGQ